MAGASCFLTITPNDVSCPTSFRLAHRSNSNESFPANCSSRFFETIYNDENLYTEKKRTEGGEEVTIQIPCDYTARVQAAAGNPVAVAMEYQALIENIMGILIGCPIHMRHSEDSPLKKSWYFKGTEDGSPRKKGCFGYVTGFHGMTETQQRGALHFHVLLYGSLTPKLLELSAGTPELEEAVGEALDSMYTAQIPRSFHVRDHLSKAMKNNYRRGAKENCKCPKFAPMATRPPPDPTDSQEEWRRFFYETVLQVGIHEHSFSCKKPPAGKYRCRGYNPKGDAPKTRPVQLIPPAAEERTIMKRDSKGRFVKSKKEQPQFTVPEVQEAVDLPDNHKTRDYATTPVRPLDERIVVWELERPLLEPLPDVPLPDELLADVLENAPMTSRPQQEEEALKMAKSFCIDQIDAAVRPDNPEEIPAAIRKWLQSIEPAAVIAVYEELNGQISDRNGYVTETSPMIANATGSSTNAILLGNTQQSRASLFYITNYITKNKMSLEHCLSALSRAQAHIEKYPSKAEDAGTKKRTVQYLMQRVLNSMYCHREVSDTQVAMALLNGLTAEATSDSFEYYGTAYMRNFFDQELEANLEKTPAAASSAAARSEDDSTSGVETDSDDDDGNQSTASDPLCYPVDADASIPTANTKVLGPAPFYKRKVLGGADDEVESIPVHYQYHWRYRGKELAMMTPAEYYSTVKVRPLPKAESEDGVCAKEEADAVDPEEETKVGRKASRIFRFARGHPLYHSHYQYLRSKQLTLIHNGYAPAHPGPPPEEPETNLKEFERHYKAWKVKADAFAKYYLCTFRPMETVYSKEHTIDNPQDFTWEAFAQWIEEMESSPRLIDRLRVNAMHNHIHGFRSKSKHQQVLNDYRARNCTPWTEAELAENKEVFSGFKTYRQDMEEPDNFGDGEFDPSVVHSFRKDVVKNVFHETQYCKDQAKAFDSIYGMPANAPTADPHASLPHILQDIVEAGVPSVIRSLAGKLRNGRLDQRDENDGDDDDSVADDADKADIPDAGNEGDASPPLNHEEVSTPQSISAYLEHQDLSKDQRRVVDRVRQYFDRLGPNSQRNMPAPKPLQLLMTGDPGTGKSYVIKTVMEMAERMGVGHVQTAAYAGIAAVNIDGTTLCSLLGIGRNTSSETDFAEANEMLSEDRLKSICDEIQCENLALLIVDEISTVDSVMIAMIDARLQRVMKNTLPFGGVAVMFCGDFNQLGAVKKSFLLDDLLNWAEYQRHNQSRLKKPLPKPASRKRKANPLIAHQKPVPVPPAELARAARARATSTKRKKAKKTKVNTSLYSRYSVRNVVHYGCHALSKFERYHLAEQHRTKDKLHMKFVKKLANGLGITLEDLAPYKALRCSDLQKDEWKFAPVLVSTNRERMAIVNKQAALFARLHGTYVFKWRNPCKGWKNKPSDTTDLYEQNPTLWQYFVPGSEAFLTKNINTRLGLVNGSPVVCHSVVLDPKGPDYERVLEATSGENRLPWGSEIILSEPPPAVNMKIKTALDDTEPSRYKLRQIKALRKHSVAPEMSEDIIIPISQPNDDYTVTKMRNGSPLLNYISEVQVKPALAFDLAFAMTVHKAQGRTIPRVVLALTCRPYSNIQMEYASVFVGMSRVKNREHIRILQHLPGTPLGNRRNAFSYLSSLLPNKSIRAYNAGFVDNNGIWNAKEALKAKF